jgi:uncharacterized protein YggE
MDTNTPDQSWHKKHLFKCIKIFVIVLTIFVGIKAVEALKEYQYIGVGTPATDVITVSGTGDVLATPDVADFSFTVSEDGTTAVDAQNKATPKVNAALAAIKAAGVADADVKTTSYDLSPKYEYNTIACPQVMSQGSGGTNMIYPCPPSGKQTLTGYTLSETIEVKVRKTDTAGDLLAKITAVGPSYISGVNFVIDNPDVLQEQAREKAIADAKSKAATLAKALGVHLSRIVNFSDNSGGPIYYAASSGGMAEAVPSGAPTPELPTGQNKITSNVSITYEIQ